ncbi:VWA domain-containing protein [Poseidonocella sedimentorum]|uniref:VWA domain-containing protein n=1 Tax=Poseidonocella sedimentorum TaxID=871652 RepID=A0A1I6CWC4_9RHOB|nr:VWA domain-containing protein [Poseidonocella sedimentorum]SFQ97393.1 hypothetical protein SAMN04515673_101471 [Poseidonocella sedimentorum]
MIAFLFTALATISALAWYLQRRPPRELQFSFSRLLDPPAAPPEPEPRFALVLPRRQAAFWLHLAALTLCLLSVWDRLPGHVRERPGTIGLRVVLDVSDSMGVADGPEDRLSSARTVVRDVVHKARQAAAEGAYCDALIAVGSSARRLGPVDEQLDRVEVAHEGGEVSALLAASLAPVHEDGCAPSHVVVVTDQPSPETRWPEDGPELQWLQVGAPVPNAGLLRARMRPAALGVGRSELIIEVGRFGGADIPRLMLTGPRGSRSVPLVSSIDRADTSLARLSPSASGGYTAQLQGGGAYSGDDRMSFSIEIAQGVELDWQLSVPAPPAVRAQSGPVLVKPLMDASKDDLARPGVFTYDGWSAPGFHRIGPFIGSDPVIEVLNFDAFEAALPSPAGVPLPAGFEPVLSDASGAWLVARRSEPAAYIVPGPAPGGAVDALSSTLFFTALLEVTGDGEDRLEVRWPGPDGRDVADAWKESDTGRPVKKPPDVSFSSTTGGQVETPFWPLFLLASLGLIALERLAALRSERRRHAIL